MGQAGFLFWLTCNMFGQIPDRADRVPMTKMLYLTGAECQSGQENSTALTKAIYNRMWHYYANEYVLNKRELNRRKEANDKPYPISV